MPIHEIPPEYAGREQSWVKHLILERYLEKLAYKILSTRTDFVYVDGFSGPWSARSESYTDTSFGIAIRLLRQVRETLGAKGKRCRIRCLFIEKDPEAFARLAQVAATTGGVEVTAWNGEFEEKIDEIIQFVNRAFALIFIDPTGWTGYALDKIAPLLSRLPGEALVNFMYDFVNRFLQDPIAQPSFTSVFGGPDWEQRLRTDLPREQAIVELFTSRLKIIGRFPHVLAAPIAKRATDRTHFYLVYGTRHPEGVRTFRDAERGALVQQDLVRDQVWRAQREEKTGMPDLFAPSEAPAKYILAPTTDQALEDARTFVMRELADGKPQQYRSLWIKVLERWPLRELEVNQMLQHLARDQLIEISGLPTGKRKLADRTMVRRRLG